MLFYVVGDHAEVFLMGQRALFCSTSIVLKIVPMLIFNERLIACDTLHRIHELQNLGGFIKYNFQIICTRNQQVFGEEIEEIN